MRIVDKKPSPQELVSLIESVVRQIEPEAVVQKGTDSIVVYMHHITDKKLRDERMTHIISSIPIAYRKYVELKEKEGIRYPYTLTYTIESLKTGFRITL